MMPPTAAVSPRLPHPPDLEAGMVRTYQMGLQSLP